MRGLSLATRERLERIFRSGMYWFQVVGLTLGWSFLQLRRTHFSAWSSSEQLVELVRTVLIALLFYGMPVGLSTAWIIGVGKGQK